MALTYGFYNSLNGDRTYDATQISSMFDGIVTDGIFESIGDAFAVTASTGMNILVGEGRAWFNHTWTKNDSALQKTVDASEVVLNRIDTVVIEVDASEANRINSIKIIKGTPGSTPVAPTLTNTTFVHQYPLADISVPAGLTTILAEHITNRIGTVDCPFITGILETIDMTWLFNQWDGEFNTWFDLIKGQLGEDPAGNLQNQINDINTELDAVETGWLPLSGTPSYSSVDGPTNVMSVSSDLTAIISRGMRIKYEQEQSLSAYWSFNTNSTPDLGSFTMGNIGTPTYTAGKFSNALTLNGSTQALSITDTSTLKPTGDFTIGVWAKTSTNGVMYVFQSLSVNANFAGFALSTSSAIGGVYYWRLLTGNNTGSNPGNYSEVIGKTNAADGNWHHVVATVKGNYGQLYVDGNLEGAGYVVPPTYAGTNYIRIGCSNTAGSNASWFNGQIDDLFFINGYALDEATIRDIYLANTAQGTGNLTLTKMGIVTNVGTYSGGATPITIYSGTDFQLVNSTISNLKYSHWKVPYRFPTSKNKWTQHYTNYLTLSQSSPGVDTWYNIGSMALSIPIGVWEVEYQTDAFVTGNAGDSQVWTALSPSTSIVVDLDFMSRNLSPIYTTGKTHGNVLSARKEIALASKTSYYLLYRYYLTASPAAIGCTGAFFPTKILARCSYL
jgi:hypothetical protein